MAGYLGPGEVRLARLALKIDGLACGEPMLPQRLHRLENTTAGLATLDAALECGCSGALIVPVLASPLILELLRAGVARKGDVLERLDHETIEFGVELEWLLALGTGGFSCWLSLLPRVDAFSAAELVAVAAFLGLLHDQEAY